MSKALKKAEPGVTETAVVGRRPELHELSPEAKQWRADNAEAARAWAEWIEKNGLPLEEYRMF
jgi:post-segregation antitoxin (ccd killing protein)